MSLEYFTIRKDQYIYFEDCKLASLLCGTVDSTGKVDVARRFSYNLESYEKNSICGFILFSNQDTKIKWRWADAQNSKCYLKTPYFNPVLLPKNSSTIVLTSSKETNGFFRSTGLTRLIPIVYSYIQHEWLQNNPKLTIIHYLNRCFHSKGIHSQIDPATHVLHLGSSNFNIRSDLRDEEVHLILFNPRTDLIDYFHNVPHIIITNLFIGIQIKSGDFQARY